MSLCSWDVRYSDRHIEVSNRVEVRSYQEQGTVPLNPFLCLDRAPSTCCVVYTSRPMLIRLCGLVASFPVLEKIKPLSMALTIADYGSHSPLSTRHHPSVTINQLASASPLPSEFLVRSNAPLCTHHPHPIRMYPPSRRAIRCTYTWPPGPPRSRGPGRRSEPYRRHPRRWTRVQ